MFEHKNWKVYAPNTDVVGGGGTESVIQPKTRFEYFLDKIAKALGGGEGGTGGGSFVIRVNEVKMDLGTKYELDKTWQEISDAIEAGMYCCIVGHERANKDDDDDEIVPAQMIVVGLYTENGFFGLLSGSGNKMIYTTDAKDGYPYTSQIEVITPTPSPGGSGGNIT